MRDVAIEVGECQHLEIFLTSRINQGSCHQVDVPPLPRDARIVFRHLAGDVEELAVGGLYDVGLGDDRHMVFARALGMGKGSVMRRT